MLQGSSNAEIVARPHDAAVAFDAAKTHILDGIRHLGKSRADLPHLAFAAEKLGLIAGELREIRVNSAMKIQLVDRKHAAAALASGEMSEKKRVAIEKARAALATQRAEQAHERKFRGGRFTSRVRS